MEDHIKNRNYSILIYPKEKKECYEAALHALTKVKKATNWDNIEGVMIGKDCRIPELYHGDDYAIIMEQYCRDGIDGGNYYIGIIK